MTAKNILSVQRALGSMRNLLMRGTRLWTMTSSHLQMEVVTFSWGREQETLQPAQQAVMPQKTFPKV